MSNRYTEVEALALIIGGKGLRYDLLDRVDAYAVLHNLYGSVDDVSVRTGIERSTVDRYIRISRLPDDVKEVLRQTNLSSYHVASELCKISPHERQLLLAKELLRTPREKARDIIRFLSRHPELDVETGVKIVLANYDDVVKATVILLDSTMFGVPISMVNLDLLAKAVNEKIGVPHGVKLSFVSPHLVIFVDESSKRRIPREKGESNGEALGRMLRDVAKLV